MSGLARQATLDDWPRARELWWAFCESRHSKRVEGSLKTFENYFAASLTSPTIRFIVLEVGDQLVGFAVVAGTFSMALDDDLHPIPVGFLRMVFIKPGFGRYAHILNDLLMLWAKESRQSMLVGHCCVGFPLSAYERLHGIKPLYTVVGKAVT